MKHKICKIIKEDFPLKLKIINNSPNQLYYIGNIDLLYQELFAIIGTRNITSYGTKVCKNFSKELALRSIPIVSGMALGTDTIAHETALSYNEKTIAVLGSGLNNIFPKENIKLFNEIIEKNGLIITEYEKDVCANKETFPQRNRIVSAISEGVLVIEAGYRSGTSITANYAKQQEKLVFAIPGKIDNTYSVGVNEMIKKGAILTTCINDILINYPQFMNKKRKSEKEIHIKNEYLKIYEILKEDSYSVDELIELTGYNIQDIFKLLSSMELENIIIQEMGVYRINEKY